MTDTPSRPKYEHSATLSDRLRALTNRVTSRGGYALYRLGVHPDWITVVGLIVVAAAAFFVARGQHQLGGGVLLLAFPLDALDGAVARAMGRTGKFGEMLDSTLDRYADGLIYAGLGYYFAGQNRLNYLLLIFAAAMGTFAVSYTRARAGELNVKMKIGLFTRFERTATLIAALLLPPLLLPAVWVLAVGTNITALQRLWYAYQKLKE